MTLHFWRTRGGVEVDFVLYGAAGMFAIEVKNAARVHFADLRSLRSFQEDYPNSRVLLLYRGRDRLVKDGVLCLPCEEFFAQFHPGRSIEEMW